MAAPSLVDFLGCFICGPRGKKAGQNPLQMEQLLRPSITLNRDAAPEEQPESKEEAEESSIRNSAVSKRVSFGGRERDASAGAEESSFWSSSLKGGIAKSPVETTIRGWMKKRGRGWPHSWQRRYLVFHKGDLKLRYYAPNRSGEPIDLKGEVALSGASFDEIHPEILLLHLKGEEDGSLPALKEHSDQSNGTNKPGEVLQCKPEGSTEARDTWIKFVNDAVKQANNQNRAWWRSSKQ